MPFEHSHYLDFQDLRGDGTIVIYKRGDHEKPKWTARLKINSVKGFIVRSTRTSDVHRAKIVAEDIFYDLEGRARRGEPLTSPTFGKLFQIWKRSFGAGKNKKYIDGNVSRLERYALPHLERHRIDRPIEQLLSDYFDTRIANGGSGSTLRNERNALNHFFRFAKRKKYLSELPEIPLPSLKPNPRPDLTEKEWRSLLHYLDEYVETAFARTQRRCRLYLRSYILLLGNTGVRVGEARRLRWSDLSGTKTAEGEFRIVLKVSGKTGSREVVGNAGTEGCLNDLYEFRTAELGTIPKNDEVVFCNRNGDRISSFKRAFETALLKAGVLYDPNGKRRVPYSLRHTYATMRLTASVNVFQLAVNMGTSVEMIESFYGKKRVRDPRMASEITKGS